MSRGFFAWQDRTLATSTFSHRRHRNPLAAMGPTLLGPWWLRYPALNYNDLHELPERGFRAVRLLPPVRSRLLPSAETLRIEIVNYDLDSLGTGPGDGYDALSYCWGSTGPFSSRQIIVETEGGARQMSISTNLYLALTSIPRNGASSQPIFADQICINQKDQREIGVQVTLMGEIYRRCAGVVIWLGPGNAVSDSYVDLVESINRDSAVRDTADLPPTDRLRVHNAAVDICKSTAQRAHGPDMSLEHRFAQAILLWKTCFPVAGYADVLKRPWFGSPMDHSGGSPGSGWHVPLRREASQLPKIPGRLLLLPAI